MALPSKPVRKVAKVGNDKFGAAKPAAKVPMPARKSVKPFSKSGMSTYTRKSAGISPTSHDVHRSSGDSYQPHNRKGGQSLSKLKKGVD